MIKLNCDIGERGPDHPVDMELMNYIQIANLACGGHAGDIPTIRKFRDLAEINDIELSAHLSYPDRDNFGRLSLNIPTDQLIMTLEDQLALLPDVKMVKFHGALYNDAVTDDVLASDLAEWMTTRGINQVIAFPDSALAKSCQENGLAVLNEAFAERRYQLDVNTGKLILVPRSKPYACLTNVTDAIKHTMDIIYDKHVSVVIRERNEMIVTEKHKIKAETVCIHSDSPIALDLAKQLYRECKIQPEKSE